MRVLVNGVAAVGDKTGIGHYTTQLVRCLRQQAGADQIGYFPNPLLAQARHLWGYVRSRLGPPPVPPPGSSAAPVTLAAPVKISRRAHTIHHLHTAGRYLLTRSFQAACRRGRYDLYHEPNYIPFPCDLPTIATLPDLSVLLHPEWHPLDRVLHFEKRFGPGLAQCAHFLAISDFSRQEIIRTLHLRPDQVTRTYMGIRPGLCPLPAARVEQTLRRLGLPPRYLLYLGTIEPRKNLLTLLHAYRGLPDALRRSFPLLLVGRWGWNADEVADFLDRHAKSCGILHVGYIAEEHLAALYNGARALVYPSLYEGFGLPPVEMLACGGAVLASRAGALVETVGHQAHLIEALDGDGWRAGLQRVLTDDDWWRQLRQGAVEAAQPFTWERCAADTLAVYRQLIAPAPAIGYLRAA